MYESVIEGTQANSEVWRYKKIAYFFSKIQQEHISDESINKYADQFPELTEQNIVEAKSVEDLLEFLEKYFHKLDCVIVSGSDQAELRNICRKKILTIF